MPITEANPNHNNRDIIYQPHPTQWLFHKSKARTKVLVCGRRWGKDRASIMEMIWTILWLLKNRNDPTLVPQVHAWYVAPTYNMGKQAYRELDEFTKRMGIQTYHNKHDFVIEVLKNAIIEIKSADYPDRLKGTGLDVVVITEAALIKPDVWYESIRPTLASAGRLGKAIINSTPKGKNWLYDMFVAGQDKEMKEKGIIESFNFPTWFNPLIPPEEIEEMRRTMPPHKFDQEIAAKFTTDDLYVFSQYTYTHFNLLPAEPEKDGIYFAGVDWGRKYDYTAVAIIRWYPALDVYHVVDYLLLKDMEFADILQRTVDILAKWQPKSVTVEINAAQDIFYTEIQRRLKEMRLGIDVLPFRTTAKNRDSLFDVQILRFAEDKLFWIDAPEVKEQYRNVYWDGLKYKHTSGENGHDDIVVATGLALYGAEEQRSELKRRSSMDWYII